MREFLKIDGVTPETKIELRKIALQRFGKASASLLIRELIARELAEKPARIKPDIDMSDDMIRLEIRLPKSCLDEIDRLSDAKFSTRNYYISSLVYEHLGVGQLQGDEIEVLRKSNYELSKIGTNLNQLTKAFNQLILRNDGEKLPEVSKKMVALKREVSMHINRVLRVLEAKTIIWESKGKGSNSATKTKKRGELC